MEGAFWVLGLVFYFGPLYWFAHMLASIDRRLEELVDELRSGDTPSGEPRR